MIRPILEYGNTIWCPFYKKDIVALERVQRRATKIIPGFDNLCYKDRLKKLGLTTLEVRRRRGDLIQTYKILTGKDKLDVNKFFQMNQQIQTTRGHPLRITKQHCRLHIRKHTFSQRVINDWNALPRTVVLANSINQFKNSLDRFWKNNPIKDLAINLELEPEA